MPGIQTGIQLNDNFTSVMYGIINSVNVALSAMDNMAASMGQPVDTSAIQDARSEIDQVTAALNRMNETIANSAPASQTSAPTPPPAPAPAVQAPAVQNFGNIEQVQQINQELQRLNANQQRVAQTASGMDILPDSAVNELNTLSSRIQAAEQQLSNLSSTPVSIDSNVDDQITQIRVALDAAVEAQNNLNSAMDNMDESGAESVTEALNQANAAARNLENTLANVEVPPVRNPVQQPAAPPPTPVPATPQVQPQPVMIPVHWQTDGLEVFTNTGIDRFTQEAQSANQMLSQLSSTQSQIARSSATANILPPDAAADMTRLSTRIDEVQRNIEQISNNPLNMGTSEANNGLEHMRSLLNQAIQEQTRLNSAMASGDVSAANESYNRLSQTVSRTEQYIRDNTNEQGRFNQSVQQTTNSMSGLTNAIRSAVSVYAVVRGIKETIDMSDTLAQTTARLDMMNDGLQSTQELTNMVYAAAQDARGSFTDMASVVARFGNNARDAFGSSEEVVAFADLVQKQMTIAGASTAESSNAMLQLSQALGSGVLRGDELNSIFEQAPNLIQNIADYLDVPIGQIREMAKEGELSADVVKAAVFSAADGINARFSQMPMTFSQIWTSFKNSAIMAFRPVLGRLNNLLNTEAFRNFVESAIEGLATLANMVLSVFEAIGSLGEFVADNWSAIRPIVYGVIGILALYAFYLGVVKAMEIASAIASGIMAVAKGIQAVAIWATTSATWAETTAQLGLNNAMYACPIVWIIALIIALIAVIFAVANATAKYTGITASGFGLICGCVNVVIQWFKNLGLSVANIFLGIGNAIAALGSNIMTAFHNALSSVQSWFYDLLSAACTVIEGICAALNKLPFVEFDYSGISSAASDYAAKAAEASGNKEDYTSITDAFNEGYGTFDTFQDGWVVDAFDAGANFGDGIAEKIDNFELSDIFGQTEMPNVSDYTSGFDSAAQNSGSASIPSVGDIGGNAGSGIGDTAANTADIKESLDITNEQLKYLRDAAERDVINRFTTAEIKVEMTNNNTVNSDIDIDGMVSKLADGVNDAMIYAAEGVH